MSARIEAFRRAPVPLLLAGRVMHYTWGQPGAQSYIARMTGDTENPAPHAELWLGDHPRLPALSLLDGQVYELNRVVQAAPEAVLGPLAAHGHLPFLLKVLEAAQPLSIQAHPDAQQARIGYEAEEQAKISPTAPNRLFPDAGAKPEIVRALTPFYALAGVRPPQETADDILAVPEFASIHPLRHLAVELASGAGWDAEAAVRAFFRGLFELADSVCRSALGQHLEKLRYLNARSPLPRENRDHWLLRAFEMLRENREEPYTPDLFLIYALNLVQLDPGQALYMPARRIHAYLEGVGVELAGRSDNVCRGGLTLKYADPAMFLRVASLAPSQPGLVTPQTREPYRQTYESDIGGFGLETLALPADARMDLDLSAGPELLLVLEGAVTVQTAPGAPPLAVATGQAVLIPAACSKASVSAPAAPALAARVTPHPVA